MGSASDGVAATPSKAPPFEIVIVFKPLKKSGDTSVPPAKPDGGSEMGAIDLLVQALAEAGLMVEHDHGINSEVFVKVGASPEVVGGAAEKLRLIKPTLLGMEAVFDWSKREVFVKQPGGELLSWTERYRCLEALIHSAVAPGDEPVRVSFGEPCRESASTITPHTPVVPFLKDLGVIPDIFPLHVEEQRRRLLHTWALNPLAFTRQPLDEIYSYFGAKIAVYFAFLGMYTRWLLVISLVGFLFHCFSWGRMEAVKPPVFGVIVNVWSVLLLQFWRRRNTEISDRWHISAESDEAHTKSYRHGKPASFDAPQLPSLDVDLDVHLDTRSGQVRPSLHTAEAPTLFETHDADGHTSQKGTPGGPPDARDEAPTSRNVVDGSAQEQETLTRRRPPRGRDDGAYRRLERDGEHDDDGKREGEHSSKGKGKHGGGGSGGDSDDGEARARREYRREEWAERLLVLGNNVLALLGVVLVQLPLELAYHWALHRTHSHPAAQYALTGVYVVAVQRLTAWGGHIGMLLNRRQHFGSTEAASNALVFKVFGIYFVQSYIGLLYTALVHRDFDKLRSFLLRRLLVTQVMDNVTESLWPYLTYRFHRFQAFRLEQKEKRRRGEKASARKFRPSSVERQYMMAAYVASIGDGQYDGTFDDFLELALQFGMVTMFASAFPLVGVFSLLNNLIEIRSDSFKLLAMLRRPVPHEVASIGAWLLILQQMGVVAIVTNCVLVLYMYGEGKWRVDWGFALVLLMEHLLLLAKSGLSWLIPSEPEWVKAKREERARIQQQYSAEILRLVDSERIVASMRTSGAKGM